MKKILSTFGLLIGVAFVIIGVLAMLDVYSPNVPRSSYYYNYNGDHDRDGFYFITDDNRLSDTETSALGSLNATLAISEAATYLRVFLGILSTGLGLMAICGFGITLCSCKKKIPQNTTINTAQNNVYKQYQ